MSFTPSFRLLLITLAAMIVGFVVGNTALILLSGSMDPNGIMEMAERDPQRLRVGLLFSHLMTFAVPGIFALTYFYGKNWWSEVNPRRAVPLTRLAPVIAFTLAALPLVAYSVWVNLQLPLPDWAIRSEEETGKLLEAVLDINGPLALVTALLAAAVSAGVGEELVFRGILQGKVFKSWNRHVAIWAAAALFSLIHFEFAGFLPRMLLGAVLGYAYHWTANLWVPILLHTVFNGVQVLATYWSGEFTPDTEVIDPPNLWLVMVGGIATLLLGRYIVKSSDQPNNLQ